MSNDIRDILSRLTALEGKITPVGVKHGLNKQQDSVPQLPALFKPKHISVLGAKKDPKHPMSGYAVGADESAEPKGTALAEAMAEIEEDMLSKVKRDLTTYLDRLEKKVKADPELLDKAVDDVEDKNPAKAGKQNSHDTSDDVEEDEDAVDTGVAIGNEFARAIDQHVDIGENDYELTDPSTVHDVEDKINMTAAQPQSPIKTVECWPGKLFEIHGNEHDGFEVKHQGRSLPSRFKNIDDADMAIKLFKAHRDRNDSSADYVEER